MGHKVKGYRRNALYGMKTRRRTQRGGWHGEVNPPGKDGWEKRGGVGSTQQYGKNEVRTGKRRERVEEVRSSEGYESNGRGRTGDGSCGYVVRGEYVKVVPQAGKNERYARRGRSTLLKVVGGEERVSGKGLGSALEVAPIKSKRYTHVKGRKGRPRRNGRRKKRAHSLERKRKRRVWRFETVVGRKVTRERVDRRTVREGRGRQRDRGRRRGGRVIKERTYREKTTGKVVGPTPRVLRKRTKARNRQPSATSVGISREQVQRHQGRTQEFKVVEHAFVLQKPLTEKERPHWREWRESGSQRPRELAGAGPDRALDTAPDASSEEVLGREALWEGRQREQEKAGKKRRQTERVRSEAVAVVVVRSGILRMEHRRRKRIVRQREGAGREHRRVRRHWSALRKSQARKSTYGLRVKGAQHPSEQSGVSPQRTGGFYGYRVLITGTINGSRRTKQMRRGQGTVPNSRKQGRIGVAEGVAKTSVGTRGVQVAYCYGRE